MNVGRYYVDSEGQIWCEATPDAPRPWRLFEGFRMWPTVDGQYIPVPCFSLRKELPPDAERVPYERLRTVLAKYEAEALREWRMAK